MNVHSSPFDIFFLTYLDIINMCKYIEQLKKNNKYGWHARILLLWGATYFFLNNNSKSARL